MAPLAEAQEKIRDGDLLLYRRRERYRLPGGANTAMRPRRHGGTAICSAWKCCGGTGAGQ